MRHTFLKLSESEPCVAFKYVHIFLSLSSVKWFITTKDNCTNQNHIVVCNNSCNYYWSKDQRCPWDKPCWSVPHWKATCQWTTISHICFHNNNQRISIDPVFVLVWRGIYPSVSQRNPVSQVWQIKREKKASMCILTSEPHCSLHVSKISWLAAGCSVQ